MKKLFYIVVASVIFTSCTKDYNCSCESKNAQETNQLVFKTNNESHATRLCNDYENRVRLSIAEKRDYNCEIK